MKGVTAMEKEKPVSAKIKVISHYRQKQIGNAIMEFPVADDTDSSLIIDMNFRQYVNVLSDILVKYTASNDKQRESNLYDTQNFNLGQAWETPVSAIHTRLMLKMVSFYI